MKILHCIPDLGNGGSQRQLLYLVQELIGAGHTLHVAYLYDGAYTNTLAQSGAHLHRLCCRGNHDPKLLVQLVSLIRRHEVDVVQTWLTQMDVLGGMAARFLGVPWVLFEQSSALCYPPGFKNNARAALGRYAQAIVSNSRIGDRYWQGRHSGSVCRHVISNGIPLQEIDAMPRLPEGETGRKPGERLVLYAGRLSPEKNLQNLIPALKQVSQTTALRAILCGDGTHADYFAAMVREQGAESVIDLVGYRRDVWAWMKSADAFVNVSFFEGQPNAVLEAAVCGCPLILSDIPAHREMMDESSALFVDASSPEQIAAAIERTLRHPEEARQRALEAERRVRRLTVAELGRRFEKVYRSLMRREPDAFPVNGSGGRH